MEANSRSTGAPRPLMLKFALIAGIPLLAFALVSLIFFTEWSRAMFLEDARRIGEEGEEELREGTGEILDTSDAILKGTVETITESNSSDLSGIPFRLWGVDGETEKDLKEEIRLHGESLRERSLSNADAINVEFRKRAKERIAARLEGMRARQDSAARLFAGRIQGHTVVFFAVSTLLLACALWAGLWFTVLKPLKAIRHGAERIGQGDLSHRIAYSSGDELGALSDAFNRMGGALSKSLDDLSRKQAELEAANLEIREWNAGLEERVRAKTAELARSLEALKRTQDELVHAAKMAGLGTLAGGLAHEFNNMIGGIRGCAEDAMEEQDPGEVKEALERILKTSTRACAVIENLLRFSRKTPSRMAPVRISPVVADTLKLVENEASRSGVSLEAALKSGATVTGDPAQLHQVFLNLVTNALHAVEDAPEKRIAVESREEGGFAVVEVSDSGPGIPPEIAGRIFEPFFTTKDGTGPSGRMGTGLGLSVSFGIVEAHRGSIEAGAGRLGGARFTVKIPLHEGTPKAGAGEGVHA